MSSTRILSHKTPPMTPQELVIPHLPGADFHDDPVVRGAFRKTHRLNMTQGVPQIVGTLPPDFQPPAYYRLPKASETLNESKTEELPPWLTAGNVLRFSAYFQEPVFESAVETVRMRRVVIYYHTEDRTIAVKEVPMPNSGMSAGTVIRRHRIPTESGCEFAEDEFIDLQHLTVGREVRMYGKNFMITSCDSNTRNYLEAMGYDVAPNEPYPEESDQFAKYTKTRARETTAKKSLNATDMELKRHHECSACGRVSKPTPAAVAAAQQFFRHSGSAMAFFGLWDDRPNHHGDLRRVRLNYYLEDDSIELLEAAQGGRAPGKLLVRQKVPRQDVNGEWPRPTLVECGRAEGAQQLTFGVKLESGYLTLNDLDIGKELLIHGKKIFIYDCDRLTREHCAKIGRKMGEAIDVSNFDPIVRPKRLKPPPHDGWGSEEDSLANWQSLIVVQGSHSGMVRDPQSNVLKFAVRLLPDINTSAKALPRHFILSYYTGDQTLQMDEIKVHNSGSLGGRFLARDRVLKAPRQPFVASDFSTIGNVFSINSHMFEVVDIDRKSQKWLNGERTELSLEEIELQLERLRASVALRFPRLQEAYRWMGGEGQNGVDVEGLRRALRTLDLTQEISSEDTAVILQAFDKDGDGRLNFGEFIKMVEEVPGQVNRSSLSFNKAGLGTVWDAREEKVIGKERRRLLKVLRDKLQQRCIDTTELFRMLSGIAPNAKMRPQPFRAALRDKVLLQLEPQEEQFLVDTLFINGECSLQRFSTILEGADEFL
eukprot:NODE_260_length_2576_cov_26.155125_g238_i0.p1 GENE.NODE_260_length_2576_cov_26.155125_g238_i0~~NODE_260_length_2576_cov_26.155125_g238_i0.p1  ORF type:complete len:767 (+),score=131.19 NODE_260_length_2576_cov_26.155125_g238_i0:105-2405(+)